MGRHLDRNAAAGRETVLVTGASSGIGRDLARAFARDGARLVLVARRRDRLEALASELTGRHGAHHRVEAVDLTDPEARRELVERLEAQGWSPDVAVLNAGFGLRGPLVSQDPERLGEMIELNVTGLVDLSRRLAPAMCERRRGGLLLVGSLAGFQPMPGFAVYAATKAFVLSFSEALTEELRPHRVSVTLLAPGPVETEFFEVAGRRPRTPPGMGGLESPEVARRTHRAFRRGRALVLQPGFAGWVGTLAVRCLPRWAVRRLTGLLSR